MAADPPVKKPKKSPEIKKRALKSAPRKGGVPALKKPKKGRRKWIWITVFLFVAFIVTAVLMPPYGTMRYGVCKTFVELNDPYPSALEYVMASDDGGMVSIDYNRIDTFGQRTLNQIRCYFGNDPKSLTLTKVDVNGKASIVPQESPDVISKFNTGLMAIIAFPPSLILPRGLSDDIKKYR